MNDLIPKTATFLETLRLDGRLSDQDWRVIDDEIRKSLMQKAAGRLRGMRIRDTHAHPR